MMTRARTSEKPLRVVVRGVQVNVEEVVEDGLFEFMMVGGVWSRMRDGKVF
jgi:hypothetical protein